MTWLNRISRTLWPSTKLAERADMSPSTFRQHFRIVTGKSPVQFQKRLRLQEARQLLLNERARAAAASALVGYESPSQIAKTVACSALHPNVMCGTGCCGDEAAATAHECAESLRE